MENFKRYSSFIKRIITASEPVRKQLLESSNSNIIKAICELLLNVLQKNIVASGSVIAKLKKHKKILYILLKEKEDFKRRKEILINNSKILIALLPLLK